MKKDKITTQMLGVLILLPLSFLLGQSTGTVPFVTQYPCTVMVLPTYIPYVPLDSAYTCSLTIKNVQGLGVFAFCFYWDPTMLDISSVQLGPFMSGGMLLFTEQIRDTLWNARGHICTMTGGIPGQEVSGSGTLAYIKIRPKGLGTTPITFIPPCEGDWPTTGLGRLNYEEIPCERIGAFYNNP